ncbi:MAG: response regulator [Ahniella sp.]|nr:response regulator [Ahniella sp.]
MAHEPLHILIVDDDERLRVLLTRYLNEQGFIVEGAATLADAEAAIQLARFDLIVLDLMLPDGDGLDFCRKLRSRGVTVPVIMLTARGDDVDRIVGLEIGADDYLAKPYNPRELLARIRAVLRRRAPLEATTESKGVQKFGPFTLDRDRRLLLRDGEVVRLTTGEFVMLSVLAEHPRQAMPRERLMGIVRGEGEEATLRSIDVTISRLRRIIEPDPRNPRLIQTVWGQGYVFVPDGLD